MRILSFSRSWKTNLFILLGLRWLTVARNEVEERTEVHSYSTNKSAPWLVTATRSGRILQQEADVWSSFVSSGSTQEQVHHNDTLFWMVHWICFAANDVDASIQSAHSDTQACCSVIDDAMRLQPDLLLAVWKASPDHQEDFVYYCMRKIAVITPDVVAFEQASTPWVARFSLIISGSISTPSEHSQDRDAADYKNLIPSQFVYMTETGQSFWNENYVKLNSPFAVPNLQPEGNIATNNSDLGRSSLKCQITSHLSGTGGMHRTMNHRIVLHVMMGDLKTTMSSTSGQVYFGLWIPSDMWLDISDAFVEKYDTCQGHSSYESSNVTCQTKVIVNHPENSVTDRVKHYIDVEDTSFDSPQYVVPILLNFSLAKNSRSTQTPSNFSGATNSQMILIELETTTKHHLRYPQPVSRSSGILTSSSPYSKHALRRWVIFPAPDLFHVSIEESNTKTVTWRLTRDANHSSIVTTVAAGCHEDYALVVTVTMTCFIAGSIFLLLEIIQVSKWTR